MYLIRGLELRLNIQKKPPLTQKKINISSLLIQVHAMKRIFWLQFKVFKILPDQSLV